MLASGKKIYGATECPGETNKQIRFRLQTLSKNSLNLILSVVCYLRIALSSIEHEIAFILQDFSWNLKWDGKKGNWPLWSIRNVCCVEIVYRKHFTVIRFMMDGCLVHSKLEEKSILDVSTGCFRFSIVFVIFAPRVVAWRAKNRNPSQFIHPFNLHNTQHITPSHGTCGKKVFCLLKF